MDPNEVGKQFEETFEAEWAFSVAPVKTDEGLKVAGTCILLGSHILFLEPRTDEDLERIKKIVNEAIDFEIARRVNRKNA